MTRALIAARKSTKVDGKEGYSLHTQDDYARAFCERLSLEVVGVASDTISGRVAPVDRKSLGAWLAEPHRFDVVVAYRTDRLSRGNQEDWTRIEHWATEHGKALIIVDSSTGIRYPARDDSDYWQWQATKREAGREWENARERSVRAQQALVAKGAVTFQAPFGYRIAGEYMSKVFEVVPEEAEVVRGVFGRVTEGMSLREVAEWFTEATGLRCGPTRIHAMVNSWTYAGRLERNGEHYGDCPEIISPGELVAAQKALRSRAKKSGGGRPSAEPALMSMTCGECGSRMYRAGNTAADARAYYCKGKHAFGVDAKSADAFVLHVLRTSKEKEKVPTLIKGKDWADEIETCKRDRRQALERDDIEKVLLLTETLKELEAREVEPDRMEVTETDRTYGDIFSAMSRDEIRAELKKWEVMADPAKGIKVISPWASA